MPTRKPVRDERPQEPAKARAPRALPAKKAAPSKGQSKPLPKAPRSPKESRDYLRTEIHRPTQDWTRLCLSLARKSYGLPGVEPTARAAWESKAGTRHAFTTEHAIPFGAVVFSERPDAGPTDAGHVFVAGGYNKAGQRLYRGNDIRAIGEVDCFTLDLIRERWGHRILGWRGNLNGFDLGLGEPPKRRGK